LTSRLDSDRATQPLMMVDLILSAHNSAGQRSSRMCRNDLATAWTVNSCSWKSAGSRGTDSRANFGAGPCIRDLGMPVISTPRHTTILDWTPQLLHLSMLPSQLSIEIKIIWTALRCDAFVQQLMHACGHERKRLGHSTSGAIH